MSTVLLDCRWMAHGGPGRVTELVLRSLAELRPPHRFVLWGPAEVEAWSWPGSELVTRSSDPARGRGQRDLLAVPRCDLAVFMHQQRPLRPMPALTFILDTISLRNARSALDRRLKRAFMKRAAAMSRAVLTISDYSRACIRRDLGVADDRVSVLRLPADADLARRVLELRGTLPAVDRALFVGWFGPHKNLARLVAAFARSRFAASGGRLLLVGGSVEEAATLSGQLEPAQRACVDVRSRCSQAELEHLFATSLFLVQPSLEEGFGLPAWEALTCGLPVCVSDGGSLPEITFGMGTTFAATSSDAMVAAVDRCADQARGAAPGAASTASQAFLARAPTLEAFGVRFMSLVEAHLPR